MSISSSAMQLTSTQENGSRQLLAYNASTKLLELYKLIFYHSFVLKSEGGQKCLQ